MPKVFVFSGIIKKIRKKSKFHLWESLKRILGQFSSIVFMGRSGSLMGSFFESYDDAARKPK